jgi:TRAP-type C4-dicarboxylate transport system permease large subunit
MSAAINSPWIFLLIMNLVMVVLGCVIEIFSAIIVVAPLIVPVARAFGVDPVHLGVIMLASLELGYLMPPIGWTPMSAPRPPIHARGRLGDASDAAVLALVSR